MAASRSDLGKLQNAKKLEEEADKCLKTSLFKWNPDYEGAANKYEKAAVAYRNCQAHDKAIKAYENASEAHYNNHSIYHSGKSLEQAANVSRDAKELLKAGDYMKRACARFNESGYPDTGGQVLSKAAQWLQHDHPEKSAEYYIETADYLLLDEKKREAGNAMKDAVRMYCRTRPRQLKNIIETCRKGREVLLSARMINIAHELVSVEVIALLTEGNALQAREVLQECESIEGFSTSEDYTVLDELVDAVNNNDNESVVQSCSSHVFRAMDPEFAKFVRDLKVGEESVAPKRVSHTSKGSTATAGTKPVASLKDPALLADRRNELFAKKERKEPTKPPRYEPVPDPNPRDLDPHTDPPTDLDPHTDPDPPTDPHTDPDPRTDSDQECDQDPNEGDNEDDVIDIN